MRATRGRRAGRSTILRRRTAVGSADREITGNVGRRRAGRWRRPPGHVHPRACETGASSFRGVVSPGPGRLPQGPAARGATRRPGERTRWRKAVRQGSGSAAWARSSAPKVAKASACGTAKAATTTSMVVSQGRPRRSIDRSSGALVSAATAFACESEYVQTSALGERNIGRPP